MTFNLIFSRTSNGIPFVEAGTGPRHAVILLGASSLFRPLGQDEGRRYVRTLSRLMPEGFRYTIMGYADHPPAGHTLDAIAEAVAHDIEHIQSPTIVIGISFGGFVALHLAARHPNHVERLVLLGSAHRFSEEGRRRMDEQLRLLREGDLHGVVAANLTLFRRPWFNWLARLKLAQERRSLASRLHDPNTILRSYERLFSSDLDGLADDARHVSAETLIIGGTADQYFDRSAFEETARLIPNARAALVPGETHMLPIENPKGVTHALEPFLSKPSARPRRGGG